MRVLLVEDEKKVASFIKKGLEEHGYAVDYGSDGKSGLVMALDEIHDLIILDINLPEIDGLTVLRQMRAKKVATPVLLLTVRATIEDKVIGLDTGADDYLAKPFSFEELLARVRALLRRSSDSKSPVFTVADLVLDPASRQVFRGSDRIELTSKEFAILEYFIRNRGRVLTRTMIIDHVWGYDFDADTNVVDVYVNYLRKKIDAPYEPKLLHTVRGTGYVLREE
ncbi:MAG: response regulator [Desulfobulbaceae bacterium]|nr:heavy metal response regulator transcription factor [Desulfofustis sp.]RZW22861.1 MAG: response regulator [Desulfobulbaceae bacterium]